VFVPSVVSWLRRQITGVSYSYSALDFDVRALSSSPFGTAFYIYKQIHKLRSKNTALDGLRGDDSLLESLRGKGFPATTC